MSEFFAPRLNQPMVSGTWLEGPVLSPGPGAIVMQSVLYDQEIRVVNKKKMTLYFSEDVIAETKREALRQDRSLSWVMEIAWKIARERLKTMPSEERS